MNAVPNHRLAANATRQPSRTDNRNNMYQATAMTSPQFRLPNVQIGVFRLRDSVWHRYIIGKTQQLILISRPKSNTIFLVTNS